MHQSLSMTLVALFTVAVGACDAPSVPEVGSAKDASAGLSAVLDALNGTVPSSLVFDRGSGSTFRGSDFNGSDIDFTAPCSGGGTISFVGKLDIRGSAGADTTEFDPLDPDQADIDVQVPTVSFEYTVAFDGCTEGGVGVDGEMRWSLSSEWDKDALELSMSWTFDGGVEFSGAAMGRCDIDFGGGSSTQADDGWTNVDLEVADGTMCGYDAAAVLDDA